MVKVQRNVCPWQWFALSECHMFFQIKCNMLLSAAVTSDVPWVLKLKTPNLPSLYLLSHSHCWLAPFQMEQWSSITSGSSLWSWFPGVLIPFQRCVNVGRPCCDLGGLLCVWSFTDRDESTDEEAEHIYGWNKQKLEAHSSDSLILWWLAACCQKWV